MVWHSTAWETLMKRSEDSIVTKRKASESEIKLKPRGGSIVMADLDIETPTEATRRKEHLLNMLKKEVKIIMEESVNRKTINAKSTYVTSLCAAVEQCLLDGLKRRLLGLFGERSTYALLHNIAKFCPEAATVLTLTIKAQDDNCRRYYEKNSLMLDAAKGGVVAALLVGPCAIDYTTMDYQYDPYEEPLAGELIERYRSTHPCLSTSPISKRPPLMVTKRGSSIVTSIDSCSSPVCTFGRDYVYSLHQNVKASLLYGKNNVTAAISPTGPPVKGYLSLHQNSPGNVTVKWSPNQLMHSSSQPSSASHEKLHDNNWLWRHIININISEIIYIHIHQYTENLPTTLIFVGGDGVQHSPMHFPAGHHLLAFLSCLESGLAPYNRLDPPLWISKEKGKILPKLRRKSTTNELNTNCSEKSKSQDYVFRLVPTCTPPLQLNESNNDLDESVIREVATANDSITKLRKREEKRTLSDSEVDELMRQHFTKACSSMRMQILARSFYGWLAYCGHLRTIRNHLSSLIDSKAIVEEASIPVDEDFWKKCRNLKSEKMEKEFLSRTYRFGISENGSFMLRRKVWPYLLGLVNWSQDFEQLKNTYRAKYYNDVVEWEKIEKIVRERDQEAFIAARLRYRASDAKFNSESFEGTSLSNDVFKENNEISKSEKDNEEEDLMTKFSVNLHRIEKDVERCDRSSAYFAKKENLQKLKAVMCTYVWRNLNEGYIQGMCDLAAPLLVILDDESLVLACFDRLMLRMKQNFPQRTGMDDNLTYMNSLLQVMDPEFFEYIAKNGDAAHLSFTYRWFLLDFKREFTYPQVFRVWEVIWAASSLVTTHFHLFFALAMIIAYRHIIIDNRMDFTDVIKFYNEMAERHNVEELLDSARNLLRRLQTIIMEIESIKN
ncbi:unnamed protein product [Cercopithifilaria johnstoni]|uniref:Rab-GAP TBC domain-containing protein n=1 Tax=Cercopithifilaria johnstoni TaxID=2874296 RepID=A0A8J2M6K0_9BILA|nr:unnamed protein product [Cercopithifilaria johnstoni]